MIHDGDAFVALRKKYSNNILVVYCDPKVHGHKAYQKTLEAMASVRRQRPFNLTPLEKDNGQKKRDSDIIFVLSTSKDLR